jgi:anti-sigma regulatory factor (Ser/Thr protein kinase)
VRHELFTYGSDEALAERTAPFLDEGLSEDEAAVVITTRSRRDLVRDARGRTAERTLFLDRDEFYTRPEAALATYDATLRRLVRGSVAGLRVIAELPICENRAEWDVWMSYEAIVNRAFADHPLWIICAYATTDVPADVIEVACQAHPVIAEDQDASHAHAHFVEPDEVLRALGAPPIPGPKLRSLPLEHDARRFRAVLSRAMADAQVTDDRADRMLVAAGEVLSNARRHGGGLRSIGVGRMGDRFVCELADHGRGIDDPFAGYIPPKVGSDADAGLGVARQLTWRLELVPSPEGLAVRLWV